MVSNTHLWTPEKLAMKTRAEIEDLRARAVRLGAADLVRMCDLDLSSRPLKAIRPGKNSTAKKLHRQVVLGYHFVCSKGRGVSEEADGRFWSGSWVVAEQNVKESIRRGAYLALHETKAATSYRQGKVVAYRKSPREMIDKENDGIEFLVEETDQQLSWVGSGSGEKGYYWSEPREGSE